MKIEFVEKHLPAVLLKNKTSSFTYEVEENMKAHYSRDSVVVAMLIR